MKIPPVMTGILTGFLFSCSAGMVYIVLLHEPGTLFYPFAALFFLAGPVIAGSAGAALSPGHTCRAFLISGGIVFAALLALFFLAYAVVPHFDRTSIRLPESCRDLSGNSPFEPAPAFELPGRGTGVLVASDEETAVVAMIDRSRAPYPGTVYIVNRSDRKTLWHNEFPDDTLMAAIDSGIVYLYHDKLGYRIDARTGARVKSFLVIDNYGGLSGSDRPVLASDSEDRRHLETSAIISSWNTDGTVRSRPRFIMNSIAYHCFVNGTTGGITAI